MNRSAGRWVLALTALFLSCAAWGELPGPLRERVQACGGCHGADGNSQLPGIPSLAAQPRTFLETQLVLIREGLRGNEAMESLMRGVNDRDIAAIAAHFSALPSRPAPRNADPALVERGRRLAAKLFCGSCHLPDYRGQAQVPRLAGQREDYLFETMRAFRDNPRTGGDTIMTAALYGIADSDIRALAHYLSQLK